MKQLKNRFKISLDYASIDQKIRIEPAPLACLGSYSIDSACLKLEKILKEVFVPTPQIINLIRCLCCIAAEHVESWYLDEATFKSNCYKRDLTRNPMWSSTGLSGLAGIGKSELLKALVRLLADRGEFISVPGLPSYPLQTIWSMTMRNGENLDKLLKPFLALEENENISSNMIKNILTTVAKRAHTCGVALNIVDEFQFITSSSTANAKAAKTLMKLELIGPPLVFCANYDMINKLAKRPHQERQRLLSKLMFVYPDPASSQAWINTLEGQIRVMPEAISSDRAINPTRDGAAIHKYTFGQKRVSAKLLNISYRHSRERSDGVLCLSDIEWAYKSSLFQSEREDVELLINQTITKKSARDDLWCDMAEIREDNVIQATQAIKENKAKISEGLSRSSMTKEDREAYDLVMGKNNLPEGEKAKVLPIKRVKPTKESLLQGSKAFLNQYGKPE